MVEEKTKNPKSPGRLLVCVTPNPGCAKLVHSARAMAEMLGMEWTAVYVETFGELHSLEWRRYQASEHLRLAEKLGGRTATLSVLNFSAEVLDYCRDNHVTRVLVGRSLAPVYPLGWVLGNPLAGLIRKGRDLDLLILPDDAKGLPPSDSPPDSTESGWKPYAFVLAVLTVCNIIAWNLAPFLELTNILMVYLAGMLVVLSKTGKGPSTLACVLGVLSFDFFIVPPQLKFAPTDSQYFITLSVVLFITLSMNSLMNRAREQAGAVRQRESRTASLYDLSRKLAATQETDPLLKLAVEHIAEIFESRVAILMPDQDNQLRVREGERDYFESDPVEQKAAKWVRKFGNLAGAGTGRFPELKTFYAPLLVSAEPVGVLAVQPRDVRRPLAAEQQHLLQALANQIGASLQNVHLSEESRKAHLKAETEQMRSALLSSVSHDLRTPLAVITGSASSLLDRENPLGEGAKEQLIHGIYGESERLNRLLSNLLDMTRLSAGKIELKMETQPLEEVVGAALSRLEKKIAGRRVAAELPEDLPMLPLDSLLMEQVFINLVENALKYTPKDSPIGVTAHIRQESLKVVVSDHGPGLAEGDEEKVFEKFYRGKEAQGQPGVGLGLAICRAAVEAHGGRIWAENRPEGGASFCFTIPLAMKMDQPK